MPGRYSKVLKRTTGLSRWGIILSIACLMATGPTIARVPKTVTHQVSGQQTQCQDLVNRIKQIEALSKATKMQDEQNQKTAQFLAQFYTAEYSAIMARISTWASLQYALFPILLAGFAILSKMDNVSVNFRLWIAIMVLLVGYLAYQGTMLNALQNILMIERYLRPLASRLVGTDQFWIHERVYRRTYPANIFYWKGWPPLLCLSGIAVVMWYTRTRKDLGGKYYALAAVALALWVGVLFLTVKGNQLEGQIKEACNKSQVADPSQNSSDGERPTPYEAHGRQGVDGP